VCDLSKDFNVIIHEILVKNLNSYIIRGILKTSFERYLSNIQHLSRLYVGYYKDPLLNHLSILFMLMTQTASVKGT